MGESMKWMITAGLICGLTGGLTGCLRPGLDRATLDRTVGQSGAEGLEVQVEGGLATFHAIDAAGATLWAQAPGLHIEIVTDEAREWTLTVRNGVVDAELTSDPPVDAIREARPLPTEHRWRLQLPAGATLLQIGAPDADEAGPFRVAVLSDVQRAIDTVDEVFAVINADPTIRFVVSAGDLVNDGTPDELDAFQAHMARLAVPLYATPGNHERGAEESAWRDAFGRGSFQFVFKGAYFTFADSSAATIDPVVYGWLEGWLAAGTDAAHLFLTHVPPIDPEGGRNGGWRSRREAAKLFTLLGRHAVDAAIYGHVHSLYSYSNGGVDAWISGGGGALPERLDGIERHFLVVDLEAARVRAVGVVRVD